MDHIYTIPNWNKVKFEKYIKSLQRKGLDVKVESLGEAIENVDGIDYLCTTYSINDEILYQESGWQFIGTIEHKENGNIIRKALEVEVPEKYYSAPNECEHCHTIRNRLDTYLVRNTNTGEFKQVGKACLKAYTGLNPAICTLAMTLGSELDKLEIDQEEVILGGYNTYGAFRGYDSGKIKELAYADIQKRGYRKNTEENALGKMVPSTKDYVIDAYYTKEPVLASDEEIAEVDKWVANLDTKYNDYFRNAKVAYEAKYYEPRDLALVISLISCYFRDKAKQAEKAAKEQSQKQLADSSQEAGYLGEVGQKVEFEIAGDMILFVNEPYAYGGDYSYTHKMIDTNGHVILWTTANKYANNEISDAAKEVYHNVDNTFKKGLKIRGTVKAHKEFRGELQTVITRGKIF